MRMSTRIDHQLPATLFCIGHLDRCGRLSANFAKHVKMLVRFMQGRLDNSDTAGIEDEFLLCNRVEDARKGNGNAPFIQSSEFILLFVVP